MTPSEVIERLDDLQKALQSIEGKVDNIICVEIKREKTSVQIFSGGFADESFRDSMTKVDRSGNYDWYENTETGVTLFYAKEKEKCNETL